MQRVEKRTWLMRKTRAIARPGAWLCLLGNLVALVALFLPSSSSLAGMSLSPLSLWDVLLSLLFQQPNKVYGGIPWMVGVVVLLVLTNGILTVVALSLGANQGKITTLSVNFPAFVLLYYLCAALITLVGFWIGANLSTTATRRVSLLDTLSFASLGDWLILVGLFLAVMGSILRWRETTKAGG